ncbi:DUF421 domain-containing protein [Nodosilinea nodulosa]|uniref:DUF421 domain-containing protein n=1 Tax=Nodosilinea nodulosa TaxID=416001 RepID=UPI00031080C7|nr:YetF domain-containing protein [Nodosilinea nodulosa]
MLLSTLVAGALSYFSVVVLLRLSGKRTLSKWNAFDFVVTVAFGSILATMVLSKQTSLLQGVVGFGTLVALQFALTWLSVRSPVVRRWIKAQPRLLVWEGKFQAEALTKERVTQGEVRAALRSKGIAALEDVKAVVLETDGGFSVIQSINAKSDSALVDVLGYADVWSNP